MFFKSEDEPEHESTHPASFEVKSQHFPSYPPHHFLFAWVPQV
jgi:hypothetical protein